MVETNQPYDLTKKRPLEIRVRDLSDEGGVSDGELKRLATNRVAADALFLIRVLFNDDESYALEIMSLVGLTHERMTVEALFDMWVRLAAYIVRDAKTDDNKLEDLKQRRFCLAVLQKLDLDENLRRLVGGRGTTQPDASENAVVPVEPGLRLDPPACENG
jgi:hypothetical protein